MSNRRIVYFGCIIVYLIVAIISIFWIFSSKLDKQAAVAVALWILSSFGALLFEPIRNRLISLIDNLLLKLERRKLVYKILIFGRAGSGKTTFIETAFTLNTSSDNTKPTQVFQSYTFTVFLGKMDRNGTEVEIADYKGQDPGDVLLNAPEEFFGPKDSRVLNAIIFIVDIVPRKREFNNDQELLNWLKTGNMLDIIRSRVQEQYEYINEAMLQIIFKSLYSKNLKTVIFVINKVDLIDKLIDDGYLNISNFKDSREYVKHHFKKMIENISTACREVGGVGIRDFPNNDYLVFTVSAKNRNDLTPLIVHLLRTGS